MIFKSIKTANFLSNIFKDALSSRVSVILTFLLSCLLCNHALAVGGLDGGWCSGGQGGGSGGGNGGISNEYRYIANGRDATQAGAGGGGGGGAGDMCETQGKGGSGLNGGGDGGNGGKVQSHCSRPTTSPGGGGGGSVGTPNQILTAVVAGGNGGNGGNVTGSSNDLAGAGSGGGGGAGGYISSNGTISLLNSQGGNGGNSGNPSNIYSDLSENGDGGNGGAGIILAPSATGGEYIVNEVNLTGGAGGNRGNGWCTPPGKNGSGGSGIVVRGASSTLTINSGNITGGLSGGLPFLDTKTRAAAISVETDNVTLNINGGSFTGNIISSGATTNINIGADIGHTYIGSRGGNTAINMNLTEDTTNTGTLALAGGTITGNGYLLETGGLTTTGEVSGLSNLKSTGNIQTGKLSVINDLWTGGTLTTGGDVSASTLTAKTTNITGSLTTSGMTTIAGNLTTSGQTTVNGLNVTKGSESGNVVVKGLVSTSDVSIAGNLEAGATSNINMAGHDLNVDGHIINAENITASNVTVGRVINSEGKITVNTLTAEGVEAGSIEASGLIHTTDRLVSDGTISASGITVLKDSSGSGGNIYIVDGDLISTGDVNIAGYIEMMKGCDIIVKDKSLKVGKLIRGAVNIAAGDIIVGNDLEASGDVTATTLTVGDTTSIDGNLTVSGVIDCKITLQVGGGITAGGITAGTILFGIVSASDLTSSGAVNASSFVQGNWNNFSAVNQSVTVEGYVNEIRNFTAGTTAITGNLTTSGMVTIAGDLSVGGSTSIGGLTITKGSGSGNADLSAGGLTSSGIIDVAGNLDASTHAVTAGTNSITAGGQLTAGDITAGDITARKVISSGNVTAGSITTGRYSATATNLSGNFTANGDAADQSDTIALGTLNITGNSTIANNNSDSITSTDASKFSIGDVTATGGKTINFTGGAMTVNSLKSQSLTNATIFNINNKITASSAFNTSTGNTIENITINSNGRINGSLTLGAEDKLTIDLGTEAAIDTIKVTGVLTTQAANEDGLIEQLYVKNGITGKTYLITENDIVGGAATNRLNTTDNLLIYTLTSQQQITVSSDTTKINTEIIGGGGSAQLAGDLNKIITNQVSMNSQDQEYVNSLINLRGAALVKATKQTIGEEATTGTTQSSLQGVLGSTGAVNNQLTSFRSGGLAAGMTSFGSSGATAALTDMADAEVLAEAYETDYTSPSDTTSNTAYNKVEIWANGYGGFGEQGTVDEMTGYNFWNFGSMIGFDYAFAEELRIGALLGYSYNKTNIYEDLGNSEDNVVRLGAYASSNYDSFFVDLSTTMGIHFINSTRNIWNGSTAKSRRTGVDLNTSCTIGYTFILPAEIQFTPSSTLTYTLFYDPNFTEIGAGAANITYDSFLSNSLIQDVQVKAGKIFRTSDSLAFLPEIWGGWEVEYLNTGGTRNTINVGQNFQTNINGMATNRGYLGIGLTALINDNVSVYGRYDYKLWDRGYNAGFSSGIKITF